MNSVAVSAAGPANTSTPRGPGGTKLDRDAFLRLLVTQMRLQDPIRTMEDREFIAQLAQFSSLEQITNLSNEIRSLAQSSFSAQAVSLIGRNVEYLDASSGGTASGRVESVRFVDGSPLLRIGGADVPLSYVVAVS